MFHISRMDLGTFVTLTPRIPKDATKDECKQTPRVCFAPTVEQCIIGLIGFGANMGVTILAAFTELANSEQCPTVYYTDEDLFKPDPVEDFHITDEHWALHPIKVERIGYLDCMRMVTNKIVEIVEEPNYVNFPDVELAHRISAEDRKALLVALG